MMMTVSNYRSRNCITTLLQHSRSSNFSQEIVLFPRDPPRQKKHNLLLFVLVLNDLVLCCCVMLTNLWPSKESTECHCKCICPPITAARCLNWEKSERIEILARWPRSSRWAALHSCTTVTAPSIQGYRFATR